MKINEAQNGDGFPVPVLEALIDHLATDVGPITKVDILDPDEHSNDRLEVLFRSGRKLVVKRGRYDWVRDRFQASRMASRLLRAGEEVVSPHHLELPLEIEGEPVLAYWWIELPTLRELWDDLPDEAIPRVMRSWGRLIRRIHDVRLPGYGCLPDLDGAGAAPAHAGLPEFLQRDIRDRLLPAVWGEWMDGAAAVERLVEFIPDVCRRVADDRGVLVHSDLHMANVLCDVENGEIECVGILDLEACFAGPPEADLASAEVLQGPCFFHPLPDDCLLCVREGYGDSLDPVVSNFFRVYHLANLGFYSALIGYDEHAGVVAEALRREATCLGTDLAD